MFSATVRIFKAGGRILGAIDTEGKQYLSNRVFFADAFNYLLYGGEQVIHPEKLRELDTAELIAPYGNNAIVPVQKYRDLLKLWNAMMDNSAIYVIFGAELQDKVHYGMPVKDALYDMIGYSKQIAEIKRSYKKDLGTADEISHDKGEFTVEDGIQKIKLSSAEFLSGLRKDDKLIPIITAVLYFGEEPWDGPKSLFEMLDVRDKRLVPFLNDYKLNMISPSDMDEDDFDMFHTELGFAMKVIKHQSEDADAIIMATNHRKIDRETAIFLNKVANLKLVYEEKSGGVDMCKALERRYQEKEVAGAIKMLKSDGVSDEDIIIKVTKLFGVTKEYVLTLLRAQVA